MPGGGGGGHARSWNRRSHKLEVVVLVLVAVFKLDRFTEVLDVALVATDEESGQIFKTIANENSR